LPKPPSSILDLAKRGAEQRYHELRAELNQLVRLFPDLRSSSRRTGRAHREVATIEPSKARTRSRAAGAAVRRSRAHWSAAARKAVSARMKKYWAGRRKAEK
jgi:hypothetical protein